MSRKLADLHVHTTASDGTQTPTEVVEEAARKGLAAIAIVDHDSLDGLEEALEAGKRFSIEVIPGIEINTDYKNREAHVLGYFVDPKSPLLHETIQRIRRERVNRIRKILARLEQLGVNLELGDVLAFADEGGTIGRPHVARAIAAKGYAADPSEAFAKFLERGKPAFVPRYKISPHEAVRIIRQAGAVPVLAHPGVAGLKDLLLELVKVGLVGVEAFHPEHTPEQCEEYKRLGEQLGLIVTGGSDAHGPGAVRPIRVGTVAVDYEVVEKLKSALEALRRERQPAPTPP